MCCRYYSAKYLYPTFRLAANDGGGKASLKHKGPRNLRTRGPILCAQADLTAIQRALVRDCGCGDCAAAAAACWILRSGRETQKIRFEWRTEKLLYAHGRNGFLSPKAHLSKSFMKSRLLNAVGKQPNASPCCTDGILKGSHINVRDSFSLSQPAEDFENMVNAESGDPYV